jgi:hypothetical protein
MEVQPYQLYHWDNSWLKYYPRVTFFSYDIIPILLSYCPKERETNLFYGKNYTVPRFTLRYGTEENYGGRWRKSEDLSNLPFEIAILKSWSGSFWNNF